MTQKSNSFERFWKELKRRKVVHVITVYATIAFVILQLFDIIAQPLKWPVWTMTFVIVLLCIGFVISVFISWIYDLTPAGLSKTKPVSAIKHEDQSTHTGSNGWRIATYISVAILVALIAFNFIHKKSLNADISKLEKSIAVLPFINDSPSDSTTYFINGLMEEILNNLQKIGAFSKVHSRTSTEQFRGIIRPPIPKIAKDLDVNFIVEGSGQKYGNFYRIRVQLIEGKTDKHLWVNSYEREIRNTKDIYGIQSQIAQAIAAELKAVITPEEKKIIEKIPTTNLTAYDFYQQGKEELNKYFNNNINRQTLIKSEELYRQSLKHDSTFMLAYVGLARVYLNKTYNSSFFSRNFLDSVLILVNKALSLDSQLSEAYTVKGRYYLLKGYNEQAIEQYNKAIKYNPNDYEAYYNKGDVYSAMADYVQAIENEHMAIVRNRGKDLPFYQKELGLNYLAAGFIDKGKYFFNEAFKLDGDSARYFSNLAWAEFHTENFLGALKLAKNASLIDSTLIINPEYYDVLPSSYDEEAYINAKKWIDHSKKTGDMLLLSSYRIALAYWKVGRTEESKYYFDQQINNDEGSINLGRWTTLFGGSYYNLAAVYAFMGDKVKAYRNLDEWNKMKSFPLWWVVLFRHDPYFDKIRGEVHFQKILKDVNAKYQAEHERVRKWLEETGQL